MSEESSPDAPGTVASHAEPATAPEEPRPRPLRQRILILSCAAVSLLMIATALVWALAFPPPGPRYSELPEPCALIGLATLNTFLPGATASQVSTASPSHGKAAAWRVG